MFEYVYIQHIDYRKHNGVSSPGNYKAVCDVRGEKRFFFIIFFILETNDMENGNQGPDVK